MKTVLPMVPDVSLEPSMANFSVLSEIVESEEDDI